MDQQTSQNVPKILPKIGSLDTLANLPVDGHLIKPEVGGYSFVKPEREVKSEHVGENLHRDTVQQNDSIALKSVYKCPFQTCLYSTVNRTLLRRHLYKHIRYKPFHCVYCPSKASKQNNIEAHVGVVHKGVPMKFEHVRDDVMEQRLNELLNKSSSVSRGEAPPIGSPEPEIEMDDNARTWSKAHNYKCSICDFRSSRNEVYTHLKHNHPNEQQVVVGT